MISCDKVGNLCMAVMCKKQRIERSSPCTGSRSVKSVILNQSVSNDICCLDIHNCCRALRNNSNIFEVSKHPDKTNAEVHLFTPRLLADWSHFTICL